MATASKSSSRVVAPGATAPDIERSSPAPSAGGGTSGGGSSSGGTSLPPGFTSQSQYNTFYNAQSAAGKAKLGTAGYGATGGTNLGSPLAPKANKQYNLISNPAGGVSYNSFAPEGGLKTAKDLATAQADIAKGNKPGTYSIGELNQPLYGEAASQMYGSDFTARDKLASEAVTKSGLGREERLKTQPGYVSATPENQKKALESLTKAMTADIPGLVETQAEVEAVKQEKLEEAFAREQQDRQLQIDRLTAANAGISRSEELDKAQSSLDAMKQSVAYMGTMGMPGVSSVHLDAISKQIDQAQTTYNRIIETQNNQKAMEAIGVDYNAANFTKKITDLQYALSQQVGEATQNAINMLTANGNDITTIEELNQVKGTMMEELGKSVANISLSNQRQRQFIIDQYNTEIAKGDVWAKNAKIVDEVQSKAKRMYVDGNGQEMLTPDGKTIPYTPAPIYQNLDANGNLVIVSQNQDGTYSSQLIKGVGTKTNKLTVAEQQAIRNDTTLTVAEKNAMLAGEIPQIQETPEYTPVDTTTIQKALDTFATAKPDGTIGGQCGAHANDYAELLGLGRIFKDPFTQKDDYINSTTPTVGSFVMWQPEGSTYGHVGIVEAINGDSLLINDSNGVKGKDGQYNQTIATRPVSLKKVLAQNGGFFDPTLGVPGAGATKVDYKQYGLLSETSFNPKDKTDSDAKRYLDIYIGTGKFPTATTLYGTARAKEAVNFPKVAERANNLYAEAAGTGLPDPQMLTANKKLIQDNNKILNKQEILGDTINKNFQLAIDKEISGNINQNATVINKLLNPIYLALGDPGTAAALVSNGTITQEFANLISIRNSAGTLAADKMLAEELIPRGTSVKAQKEVAARLQAEAANIHSALKDQNTQLRASIDPLELATDNPNRQARIGGTTPTGIGSPTGTGAVANSGYISPYTRYNAQANTGATQ